MSLGWNKSLIWRQQQQQQQQQLGVLDATDGEKDGLHLCCPAPPQKKCHFVVFLHKSTTGSTSTCVFFLYIPSLYHNFSYTLILKCPNYSVARRQQISCGLITATFSLKFENVVPEGWIWFFPFYIRVIILLLYKHVRVRVVTVFFCIFGFKHSQQTSTCYHMIRNVVYVSFWGTLLRPTAGAVLLFQKCTTLQNDLWLCASIHEESYAISLWLSTATFAVNIA